TSPLSGVRSSHLSYRPTDSKLRRSLSIIGGDRDTVKLQYHMGEHRLIASSIKSSTFGTANAYGFEQVAEPSFSFKLGRLE
ncbi:MAG: hypothetical protein WA734_12435, partial [Candidatus Acidiferrales bacterium]